MAAGMVYAGRVVAVEDGGPRVVVPQLGGTGRYGPLPSAVPDLAVGEAVIVTSLGTTRDQLVILGRMAGRAPELDEIPDLAEALAADQAQLDAHAGRLDTAEGVNAAQNGRLTAVESTNTAQDGRLTATEGVANGAAGAAAAAGTAVSTLRTDTAGKATTKGDLLIATAAGTLARQPVVPTGWMLSGDPNSATGWASRDVLGLPRNLAGVTTPTRFVGGVAAVAPTTGTFAVGDFVIAATGDILVCTTAGTPGTWSTIRGNGPRGPVARVRRITSVERVSGQDPDNAFKLLELSAAVLAGREYEIKIPNWGVYSQNDGTAMRGGLTYTIDGSVPTPFSPVLTWSQVECRGSGRVVTLPITAEYLPTTNHTLRVCAYMQPTPLNGGNWGTYATADNWQMVLSISDTGPAIARTGTVF